MNVSYQWLREFCAADLTPHEIRDLLTARCATVEEVHALRSDLAGIVVGRVVHAERHPNSDRLWVTKVDDGGAALLDVVCGAPVVTPGTLYPFARVGVTLPGGVTIERRKIRGAVSAGMLCSARELALGDDQDGILALDVDVPTGTSLLEALPVGDVRLVIDVLPNRPDLLSHLGVAREVAAATGLPLTLPVIPRSAPVPHREGAASNDDGGAPSPSVAVRVEDPDGAPRYLAVAIRGVRVGRSPEWLVRRLEAVGARSVNNVVDATNYMLFGFGQPMHAFDLDALAGRQVVVRRARPDERITTLDGVERSLTDDMTVIADAERPQAVAGVLGARTSEVTGDTRDILLEVAAFEPRRVRAARRALGVSTDASYRFERGVDAHSAPRALAYATELILAVAGGRADEPVDVGGAPPPPGPVLLRTDRAARIIGVPLSEHEIRTNLRSLGFAVEAAGAGSSVTPPSWRADIEREIDLIEEIARTRGFDTLPCDLRPYRPGNAPDSPLWLLAHRLRVVLGGTGLLEARPMPFVRGGDATHVRVLNPLAEHEAHLRCSLLESLARRAEYNLARMEGNVRLYEIGSAFLPAAGPLPREEVRAAALLMGDRRPPHFTEPRPPRYDEWDAKGLAEQLADAALGGIGVELVGSAAGQEVVGVGTSLWSIRVSGEEIGRVVRLRLDAPVWAAPAFGIELRLAVQDATPVAPAGQSVHSESSAAGVRPAGPARPRRRYRPVPSTPAALVDVALLVPDRVSAADVERVLRRTGGELLEQLALFDEFRGADLPPATRSLAWRLVFRDPERTLREKEIEGRRQRMLRALEGELGVRPRVG